MSKGHYPFLMMQRLRRYLVRSAILVVWVLVMIFPFVAFTLATRGQLQIGSSEQRHIRLFMVQEKEANGVGVEWIRPHRRTNCLQGSITYLMWAGEGDNVTFCQCLDPATNTPVSTTQTACQSP